MDQRTLFADVGRAKSCDRVGYTNGGARRENDVGVGPEEGVNP